MRARSAAEGVVVELEDDELELLARLTGEMKMLLEADIPREDQVLRRLFPDAHEDPEEERSYRRLVGPDLEKSKLESLEAMRASLDPSRAGRLSFEEAAAWLRVLTDLRLAIGTRLGATEEKMAADVDPDHPDAAAYSVLHWLGWVQESMLYALPPGGSHGSAGPDDAIEKG